MDYPAWRERERKARLGMLHSARRSRPDFPIRVCALCGELLLCHETSCPDCGSRELGLLAPERPLEEQPVRLRLRYREIFKKDPC